MDLQISGRLTIDKVDSSKPMEEWKPLLADRGRRRHLSYSMDFDTRSHFLEEPGETWEELPRRLHLENREKLKAELAQEFGSHNFNMKLQNFADLQSKPFSVLAYHNAFHDQARKAFVIGAYYPALVSACTLGERILNHLVIDLREFFRATPQYRNVYRKDSFDNWQLPIDTLEAWGVLVPKAVVEFRALAVLRNRSIHFNVSTYTTLRDDALRALLHMREIIEQQFAAWGDRPWFIERTRGHLFISRDWENDPFVKTYHLPTCPFVGPNFAISFEHGLRFHDQNDYGDGDWTDEEFAQAYETRRPEDVVSTESNSERENDQLHDTAD